MMVKKYLALTILIISSLAVKAQNKLAQNKPVSENQYILLKNEMLGSTKSSATTKVFLKENKLPFFCDLELKLEASAKMPIKIRLGEVQAVERKEGKY